MNTKDFILYTRNFIFGAEDSLVSTVGLLAGIASAGVSRQEIIVTGFVLIFVEAFSMCIGSFLSERTTEEFYSSFKADKSHSVIASIIMFFSYLLCGLIPLLPYVVVNGFQALVWSIGLSLVALFVLGFVSAKILNTHVLKSAIRMALIGGFAILLGVIVGFLLG